MKLSLILFLIAASFCLTGCATDPGDRAFFETGWVRPGERDAILAPKP